MIFVSGKVKTLFILSRSHLKPSVSMCNDKTSYFLKLCSFSLSEVKNIMFIEVATT